MPPFTGSQLLREGPQLLREATAEHKSSRFRESVRNTIFASDDGDMTRANSLCVCVCVYVCVVCVCVWCVCVCVCVRARAL